MPSLPSSVSLTSIADGSAIIAADHRNNYAAAQTAVNALIAALSSGTVGQVLQATSATAVQWQTLLQLVDTTQKYKVQFASTVGVTDGSGLLAVVFATPFTTACTTVVAVNGDSAASGAAGYGVKQSTVTVAGFSYATPLIGGTYRANWLAIGY